MSADPHHVSEPAQPGGQPASGGAPGQLIVIGGGCYGSYHARQLSRARARGRLSAREIVIVDRDPECAARREFAGQPGFRFVTSGWDAFLDDYFETVDSDTRDHVVPTPIAAHLMFHWLSRRAATLCGEGAVRSVGFSELPDTPYATRGTDGSGYLSFATWICPVTCYEPATCPETRGPKSWEMDDAVFRYARHARGAGTSFDGVEVFRIRHLAWGIASFPAALALAAGRRLERLATPGGPTRRVMVATVSSCHGIMNALELTPPAASGQPPAARPPATGPTATAPRGPRRSAP